MAVSALRPVSGGRSGAGAAALALDAAPLHPAALVLAAAAVVAAALLGGLVFDVVKLRRVKRTATPLGIVAVRRAAVGTSPTVVTPTAIGYLHPAVVVPVGFRARVDANEWDAVLAHECAHLARCDDWAKGVQSALVRAAWWMPGLWVLGRALDLERELASDEQAARATGARRYAACLLRLATDRGAQLAPAFGARRAHLAIRVERLLRPLPARTPVVRAMSLGAATAVALAVVGGAVLAVPGTAPQPPAAGTSHRPIALARSVHAPPPARRRPHPARAKVPGPTLAQSSPPARFRVGAPKHARSARPPAARGHVPAVAFVRPARHALPYRVRVGDGAEFIVALVPKRGCSTCFGPLRSADFPTSPDAVRGTGSGPPGETSTVVADEPTSGPVTLGPQLYWMRIPMRALVAP